jgi:glycosyltransferase involved in cell wall biosynthesis
VQTFVYREAVEMVRSGMEPWLVSIRRPEDPVDLGAEMTERIFYLPEEKELRAEVDAAREAGKVSRAAKKAMERRKESDGQRIFEAIWLEPKLRERGVKHVHAHFGGMAARTAWWLRELFGFTYSFTGHANDIFCETEFPVTNADLVRGARLVVTETDFARRWMEEKHAGAKGKVVRVFNGIAVELLGDRRSEMGDRDTGAADARSSISDLPSPIPPMILSVGRYVEKKGFGDLIAACGILRERGVAFRCALVGGGPLEEVLRAQIAELGLEEVVELVGPRPQAEVRRLLAEARIFVLACVVEKDGGSDNLPTVIMEAMACGTPVISTRVAGVPEMIANGTDGLLVAPNDPAALAAAMEKLLGSPAFAASLAARAREVAEARFAVEKTVKELRNLLVTRCGVVAPAAVEVRRQAGWWERFFGK